MDKTTAQQQAEAMLALHATQGERTPQGEAPDNEELALLLDGQLDFKRRKEVITHLDADTALFARWISLLEATTVFKVSESTPLQPSLLQRLQQWFTPMRAGFIGTALAAITTVAILVPLLNEPTTLSPQQARRTPDYASSGYVQQETSVLAGIVLSYQNYSEALKQTLPVNKRLSKLPAPALKTLSSLNPVAIQFGESLIESYRGCQQKDLTLIKQQRSRLRQLAETLELSGWAESGDLSAFCQRVDKEIIKRID